MVGADESGVRAGEASPRALDLLARMQEGDREAAAVFMVLNGGKIRRRIRRRLNRVVRRLFDSQDLLSTVSRRLDLYVQSGRLTARTEEELWSFLYRVVENAFIDKSRAYDRMQRSERPEVAADRGALGSQGTSASEGVPGVEDDRTLIKDCLGELADPIDREILNLWLRGTPLGVIADLLGVPRARLRKRWQRIRRALRQTVGQDRQAGGP